MNDEIPRSDEVGERQLRSEIEPRSNNARDAESVWQRDDLLRLDLKLVPNEPLSMGRPVGARQRDMHRGYTRLAQRQWDSLEQRGRRVAKECGRRHPKLEECAALAKTEILGGEARTSNLATKILCSESAARDDPGCSDPRQERFCCKWLWERVAASHRVTLVASLACRSPHPQPRA